MDDSHDIETFDNTSKNVKNAKQGKFATRVKSCISVHGSKYKPGHWQKHIWEINTDDGVYICGSDLSSLVGTVINVSTNLNQPDIGWTWLNIESLGTTNTIDRVLLEEVDWLTIPKKQCCVYRIEVGADDYIGFTTKTPKSRVEEHLEAAKGGSPYLLHRALRNWGYVHSWSVVGEYENEVEGLLSEISQIKRLNPALNTNMGGQGAGYVVFEAEEKMPDGNLEMRLFLKPKDQ